MTKEIIIYTDGGCRGNGKENNVGGWGAVLSYSGIVKELYGGEHDTTNNMMELTSIIRALQSLKRKDLPVRVHMDSAYVVNGINDWVTGWKKRGWKKADKKPILNLELWKELDGLVSSFEDIQILKVKAHVGIELNEVADGLANKGMDELETWQ